MILPIVYYSRKMTTHELKYPVHEKELLAIIAMLDQHSVYLGAGDRSQAISLVAVTTALISTTSQMGYEATTV